MIQVMTIPNGGKMVVLTGTEAESWVDTANRLLNEGTNPPDRMIIHTPYAMWDPKVGDWFDFDLPVDVGGGNGVAQGRRRNPDAAQAAPRPPFRTGGVNPVQAMLDRILGHGMPPKMLQLPAAREQSQQQTSGPVQQHLDVQGKVGRLNEWATATAGRINNLEQRLSTMESAAREQTRVLGDLVEELKKPARKAAPRRKRPAKKAA